MNKIFKIMCILILLAGCQLAQPSLEMNEAKLIGVYVTTDDIYQVNSNNGILLGETVVEDDLIHSIIFEGTQGIVFALIEEEIDNETTQRLIAGPDVFDETQTLDLSDSHSKTNLKGSIKLWNQEIDYVIVNPIYQTADDQIYLEVGSQGVGISSLSEVITSYWLEEKTDVDFNGQSREQIIRIELDFTFSNYLEKTSLVMMNENHDVLSKQDFLYNQPLTELTLSNETAYLIVENIYLEHGEEQVSRDLVNQSSTYLEIFVPNENGYFNQKYVPIEWK